ncbi:MAG: hypothetical protein H7144_06035 [Burkholderiales bacterium]|nr:hypothetical protein [Phycisphaerae bacterium]
MESLTEYIRHHFLQLWPGIRDDPEQLRLRLARRRLTVFTRPPRAWCIAIRAADRRIRLRTGARIHPELAAVNREPHTLLVDVPLLRRLCTVVVVDPPGEEPVEVTPRLGRSRTFIYKHIRRGDFRVRYIKLLGGKRGKPVPLIEAQRPLDPCSKSAYPPDVVWGDLWPWHVDAMPPAFAQKIRREPRVHSDGRFPSWRWVCPECSKQVKMLFCPIRVPHVQRYCDLGLKHGTIQQSDYAPRPRTTFACQKCHNVYGLCRGARDSWNRFVTYLTAGICYGHEIPKPAWWFHRQARYYKCQPRPTPRRDQVLERLLTTDFTYPQIARQLKVTRAAIHMQVYKLFNHYGVHSRGELRERVRLIRELEVKRKPVRELGINIA